MMAFVTPKTDWVNGDYFNIDPDYNRIKGNIEYIAELAKELYLRDDKFNLATKAITDYADVSFFNDVTTAISNLMENYYSPPGSSGMRICSENAPGWDASDLNTIESNILKLYQAFTGQKQCVRRLSFKLGGNKFGN